MGFHVLRRTLWELLIFLAALCLLLKYGRGLRGLYSERNRNNVAGSTLGFEAIFAINGPHRTDRKDSLTLAAAHTGIELEWINGFNASDIDERAYPPGNHRPLSRGNLGSWRAHMNAIRTVVERNLSNALILEDDVDWDFRLREQLSQFAIAGQQLPELIEDAELQARRHVPSTDTPATRHWSAGPVNPVESAKRSTVPLPSDDATSYGQDWDILWLGHCGTSLPPNYNQQDRMMLLNDPTVPKPQDLKPYRAAPVDDIAKIYPPHTRTYHRTHGTLCTLAYAVTQQGARKVLYEHGIRNFDKGYDFALSEWCDGKTRWQKEYSGNRPMCLTSSPPVFSHFWPVDGEAGGGRSDIAGVGAAGVETGSRYLVRSVRGALQGIVDGEVDL